MRLFFKFWAGFATSAIIITTTPDTQPASFGSYNPFPEDAAFRLSSICPVLTQAIIALKELFFKHSFWTQLSIPYFFHFCCVNIYIFIKKDEKMAKFMNKAEIFPVSSFYCVQID